MGKSEVSVVGWIGDGRDKGGPFNVGRAAASDGVDFVAGASEGRAGQLHRVAAHRHIPCTFQSGVTRRANRFKLFFTCLSHPSRRDHWLQPGISATQVW